MKALAIRCVASGCNPEASSDDELVTDDDERVPRAAKAQRRGLDTPSTRRAEAEHPLPVAGKAVEGAPAESGRIDHGNH